MGIIWANVSRMVPRSAFPGPRARGLGARRGRALLTLLAYLYATVTFDPFLEQEESKLAA